MVAPAASTAAACPPAYSATLAAFTTRHCNVTVSPAASSIRSALNRSMTGRLASVWAAGVAVAVFVLNGVALAVGTGVAVAAGVSVGCVVRGAGMVAVAVSVAWQISARVNAGGMPASIACP